MWRVLAILAVASATVLGTACATYLRPIHAPEIYVVEVQPLEGGNFEQRFRLDLRVQNPNDFDLEIDGLDFVLEVNDARLTRGLSNEAVTIPRFGEATFQVTATTTVFDLLRQLTQVGNREGVDYTLRGRLFLANSPRRVEFERQGSLLP